MSSCTADDVMLVEVDVPFIAVGQVVTALNGLSGELAGRYFPLSGMSEEDRVALVQSHFLFKRGDRFLESAGANRDWPGA